MKKHAIFIFIVVFLVSVSFLGVSNGVMAKGEELKSSLYHWPYQWIDGKDLLQYHLPLMETMVSQKLLVQ